jgi:hypothetical protein
MSEENDEFRNVDREDRARELIMDLTRDGYPLGRQLGIVTDCLCILLARKSDNEEQLAAWAAHAQKLIDLGTKIWFERKQETNGSEPRD